MSQPPRPFGIASLRRLLALREHQAFLDELQIAMEDADPSGIDFLRALGGDGLYLLLCGEPTRVLLTAYSELLVSGKIDAPPETVLALRERFPSPGLESLVQSLAASRSVREGPDSLAKPTPPTIQLKRVIQILDMGLAAISASDATGIRRSVFRSHQERTFLQALALRFPGLHAFPNYPLDQLADFEKLNRLLDHETLEYGRHCRVAAILVLPSEGDPVAAFELDSLPPDNPSQARLDRLRNRLFRAIQIPFFRLRAEDCASVGIDEWYAILTDEVAHKIDCGRRIRSRAMNPMLVPTN